MLGFNCNGTDLGLPDGAVFGTEAIGTGTVGEESTLQVGVAEKSQRRGKREQRDQCIADGNDVGIFVARRAVNQLHLRKAFQRKRALRQSVQPLVMLGS